MLGSNIILPLPCQLLFFSSVPTVYMDGNVLHLESVLSLLVHVFTCKLRSHLISIIQQPDAQLPGNDPKSTSLNKRVKAKMLLLMALQFASQAYNHVFIMSLSFSLRKPNFRPNLLQLITINQLQRVY